MSVAAEREKYRRMWATGRYGGSPGLRAAPIAGRWLEELGAVLRERGRHAELAELLLDQAKQLGEEAPDRVGALVRAVKGNAFIRSLDLSDDALNDELAASHLGTLLAGEKGSLAVLTLRHNNLKEKSGKHLFDALASNKQLHELDLSCNPSALMLSVAELDKADRLRLKAALPKRGRLPDKSQQAYEHFSMAVAMASADRWRRGLSSARQREAMVWRLLRLQAAPYFVLGATTGGDPLRYRVGTPWDFRSRFEVKTFDAWPDGVGQPMVRWRAEVHDRVEDERHAVEGHVEIRWTHGRFSGAPEAKVHLDTHPHEVPGYFPLR